MKDETVRRPIFVVGSGRSGTTVLYEMLCRHPDLAWFSNYTETRPRLPQLAALSRAGEALGRLPGLQAAAPREGHSIWDSCRDEQVGEVEGPLTDADATPTERQRANRVVRAHMRWQGKPRFVNKNTRNTVRMRYLDALFEDAIFVHIYRDPRAAIASLLKVSWWPELRVWSAGYVRPPEWAAQGGDPVELAAGLWAAEVDRALEDREHIPSDRYMELAYESLIAEPDRVLRDVERHCRLERTPRYEKSLESFRLTDRNFKFKSQFSDTDLATIAEVTSPVAARLGYSLT